MPLERGALLNKRYRIVEILGQGGMGSVYRAVDENLGVDLAVKENLFTSEEYSRQFRREASILASLRHPNLPRVTDHFDIERQGQYLVMDFIDGEDLRQRMDRDGKLPEEEVIVIGMALCDALTYLHKLKPQVLHRDVKPGNVKITPDGKIYLVDFGLAKIVEITSQNTTTGARAMTPGYSPPEQYGTARTDERSDIYSLGATLYAALCGALPEDGLARAMDQTTLTPVRKHNPKVGKKLAAVIEKALAVQPDARYQSGEEMKQALAAASNLPKRTGNELTVTPPPALDESELTPADDEILSRPGLSGGGNGHADEEPTPARISKPVFRTSDTPARQNQRKNRQSSWLLVLLLIFLLGAAATLAFTQNTDFQNRMLALIEPVMPQSVLAWFASPTPTPSQTQPSTPAPTATFTPTPSVTTEPTATLTPTATPTATPTETPTQTMTPDPTEIPLHLGGGSGEIAFVSNRTGEPQIWVINVEGTRWRQITSMPEGACQPDWSPDGQKLVFISPCKERGDFYVSAGLFSINADGSELTALLGRAAGDYDPDWSPDGTRIVFTTLRGKGVPQIYVLYLEDGSIEPLATESSKNAQPAWSPDGTKIVFISGRRNGERLWIMNADGSEQTMFSTNEMFPVNPEWSPDGANIIFTERSINGTTLPKLLLTPFNVYSQIALFVDSIPRRDGTVSPDGKWLVYESWPEGDNHDIVLFNLQTQVERILVGNPFYDMQPVWRPLLISP